MVFEHREWLNLLWLGLVPLLLGAFEWTARSKRLARLAPHGSLDFLYPRFRKSVFTLKKILIGLAVALGVIAMAGPKWGYTWQERTYRGVDIMVAVDTSTSMLATDMAPNRLERAKREIIDLLGMLKGDRIGLVAFAGQAFVQCPLTIDYDIVRLFIDHLSHDLIPTQGTSIADAIDTAVSSFEQGADARSEARVLILITDGEDHSGRADAAVAAAVKAKVKIFAIGIGETEGAPVPNPSGGFKRDASGKLIMSKLDTGLLKKIADETGGRYVHSTTADFDLEEIFRSGIRGDTEEAQYQTKEKVWKDRFYIFGLLAFLLLAWEMTMFAQAKKNNSVERP